MDFIYTILRILLLYNKPKIKVLWLDIQQNINLFYNYEITIDFIQKIKIKTVFFYCLIFIIIYFYKFSGV